MAGGKRSSCKVPKVFSSGSSVMLTLRYRYVVGGTGYPVMIVAPSSPGRLPESVHDTRTLRLARLSPPQKRPFVTHQLDLRSDRQPLGGATVP